MANNNGTPRGGDTTQNTEAAAKRKRQDKTHRHDPQRPCFSTCSDAEGMKNTGRVRGWGEGAAAAGGVGVRGEGSPHNQTPPARPPPSSSPAWTALVRSDPWPPPVLLFGCVTAHTAHSVCCVVCCVCVRVLLRDPLHGKTTATTTKNQNPIPAGRRPHHTTPRPRRPTVRWGSPFPDAKKSQAGFAVCLPVAPCCVAASCCARSSVGLVGPLDRLGCVCCGRVCHCPLVCCLFVACCWCVLGAGRGRPVADSGLDAFSQYPSHGGFATPVARPIAETGGVARGFLSYYHRLPPSRPVVVVCWLVVFVCLFVCVGFAWFCGCGRRVKPTCLTTV